MPTYDLVRDSLLEHKVAERGLWPWLSDNKKVTKSDANKFLLGAVVDLQQSSDRAWDNARRCAEEVLGDPRDLWSAIADIGQERWQSPEAKVQFGLHWIQSFHDRVWRIANDIKQHYECDARRIWTSQPPACVVERLEHMRVGPQISRMVVGALIDTKQIQGTGELKADRHVRRVLGRVFLGKALAQGETQEAHNLANKMVPDNTWALDLPLYRLGQRNCKATNPLCESCYLTEFCVFFNQSLD